MTYKYSIFIHMQLYAHDILNMVILTNNLF